MIQAGATENKIKSSILSISRITTSIVGELVEGGRAGHTVAGARVKASGHAEGKEVAVTLWCCLLLSADSC